MESSPCALKTKPPPRGCPALSALHWSAKACRCWKLWSWTEWFRETLF